MSVCRFALRWLPSVSVTFAVLGLPVITGLDVCGVGCGSVYLQFWLCDGGIPCVPSLRKHVVKAVLCSMIIYGANPVL